jgi:methylated-DNA-[protein]-cysteine S-methyltransferase
MDTTDSTINSTSNSALPRIWIGMLPSSPIGPLWVAVTNLGLVAVEWDMPQVDFIHRLQQRFHSHVAYDETRTAEPLRQLSEYLSGERREFTIPLDFTGLSPFQVQALRLTSNIPYGQTCTYRDIAVKMGKPQAARAVGRAEATNPIPLVIPCHRVLGSEGSLHGYGGPGGIKMKAWLLQLERT